MDENSFAYGNRGQYVTISGICRKIGHQSITIDETTIKLADIVQIESPLDIDGHNLFDSWDGESA